MIELKDFLPDFLWVLRDAMLEVSIKGKLVSPKEFLVNLLRVDFNQLEDKNRAVKDVLTKCFRSIDMECIPPPHQDPDVMSRMDIQDDAQLSRHFVPELRKVIEKAVKSTTHTKSFGKDSLLDGTAFAVVVETLVEVINQPGNIPPLPSLWEGVVDNIFHRTTHESLELYTEKMEAEVGKFPLEVGDLTKIHQMHYEAVIDQFKTKVCDYVVEDL